MHWIQVMLTVFFILPQYFIWKLAYILSIKWIKLDNIRCCLSSAQWPNLKAVNNSHCSFAKALITLVDQSKHICIYSWSTYSFFHLDLESMYNLTLMHYHLFSFFLGFIFMNECELTYSQLNFWGNTFEGVPGSFNIMPDLMYVWPE